MVSVPESQPTWPTRPQQPPLYDPSEAPFGLGVRRPAEEAIPPAPVRPTMSLLWPVGIMALVTLTLAGALLLLLDGDRQQVVSFGGGGSGSTATNLSLLDEALDVRGVLNRVQESVIAIETNEVKRQGFFSGAGSGVIISDDGLILTNDHVISGADTIEVTFFNGTVVEADLVGSFPNEDVALIQARGVVDTRPADLGTAETLLVGDEVVAIGNALGLGGQASVTLGIVSAKDRELQAGRISFDSLIQTDAAINPGNSGGPLVNAAGQVVGINTAIIDDAQNIGFAISIDVIIPLIEQLVSGDASITPETAFFGASTKPVSQMTAEERSRFPIATETGAFVVDVFPESAAGRAGLEPGDVLVKVDGRDVSSPEDVARSVRRNDPGDAIDLEFRRGDQTKKANVALGTRADAGN